VDWEEPDRLAQAVETMHLRYVVVTSVDRDDLPDGGAGIFALTIERIRACKPDCSIEVLVPDFQGKREDIATVVKARPDVFNHNIETVPRLYRRVRPGSKYPRSLDVLRYARELDGTILTKSGLMVGLGESEADIAENLADLRSVGCSLLTMGQYLRPGHPQAEVARFYPPEEFEAWKARALALGFRSVEAGPFVRSSYHAQRMHGLPAAGGAQ